MRMRHHITTSFSLLLFGLLPGQLCCFFRSNRIILKILFSFHQLNIPTRLDQAALNRLIKLPFAHFHHFFNIAYLQIQQAKK